MTKETAYRIYLVEDDRMLADEICRLLERWGYEVTCTQSYDDILAEVAAVRPHVILMDVNIPRFDGFYWCRRIREVSAVPVIYLSSRDSSMDVIMGMNSGGDDYLTKPFDNDVLVAKIRAIIRRAYQYRQDNSLSLEADGLIVLPEEGIARCNGKSCELTKHELRMLSLLIENRGKVVSREALMRRLWDNEVYVNDNTLTVNINRLRQKLEELGMEGCIVTKKGMGYQII